MIRFVHLGLKFLNHPPAPRLLLLESALWLSIARASALLLPFKAMAPFLGAHMKKAPREISRGSLESAAVISISVKTMARHLPWNSRCLVQAVAAKKMLDRRQIPSTLFLGVARASDQEMSAHAWLKSGDYILTGNLNLERFVVVSTFS